MKNYAVYIILFFMLSGISVYGASTQGTIMDKLLDSNDSSFDGMKDIPANDRFFNHEVDRSTLDSIKNIIGENLFVSLNLNFDEGKTIAEFIEARKAQLKEHPHILAALTYDVTKSGDISLVVNDDSAEDSDSSVDSDSQNNHGNSDVSAPARTISADDFYEYGNGPGGSPRNFREFLARNYNMSNKPPVDRPDDIEAFSVFFNYANNVKNKGGSNSSDTKDLLTDRFVRDLGDGTGTRPDRDSKPLFLPSGETLKKMGQLLLLTKELELAQSSGHNPELSSIDSDTMADFMKEAGISDMSELRGMSIDDIRKHLSGMVEGVVKKELKDNDYLANITSVAVGTDSTQGTGTEGSSGIDTFGSVRPEFVVGSNEATAEVDLTYSDAMGELTEAQRTLLEMKNDGMFHLNGNPEDVKEGGKLYHFLGTPDISDGYLSLMERPREMTDE